MKCVEYDHTTKHWNEFNIIEIANLSGIKRPLFVFTKAAQTTNKRPVKP